VKHGKIPRASVDLWPPFEKRLHVIMTPAVTEGEVEDAPCAMVLQIQDRMCAACLGALRKPLSDFSVVRLQKHVEVAAALQVIKFVANLERFDPRNEFVGRVGNRHRIRNDRRVGQKLRSQ
jgi:hypothetical protein